MGYIRNDNEKKKNKPNLTRKIVLDLNGWLDDGLHGLGVGEVAGVELDGEVSSARAADRPRADQTHHHVLLVEDDE